MTTDTTPTAEAARICAADNPRLGGFVIDMTVLAGLVRHDPASQRRPGGRLIALDQAHQNAHLAMIAARSGRASHTDVYNALVTLAAQAALLAVEGDANWPYEPAEVKR